LRDKHADTIAATLVWCGDAFDPAAVGVDNMSVILRRFNVSLTVKTVAGPLSRRSVRE
jgi:hypothetical protein